MKMKHIWFIGDKDDCNSLNRLILMQDLFSPKEEQEKLSVVSSKFLDIRFYASKRSCDDMMNCIVLHTITGDSYISGDVVLQNEKDNKLLKCFRAIKKQVNNCFIPPKKGGSLNIGRHLYNEWYNRRVKVKHMFLQSRVFEQVVSSDTIQRLISFLQQKGYCVSPEVIKDEYEIMRGSNFKKEKFIDYIIYPKDAKLFSYETSLGIQKKGSQVFDPITDPRNFNIYRKWIYSAESEAVFATYRKRKREDVYYFSIDERCYDERNPNQKMIELFSILRAFFECQECQGVSRGRFC